MTKKITEDVDTSEQTLSVEEEEVEREANPEEEMEDFFEKPVLIALGLFVLLIVAVMIIKVPPSEEPPPPLQKEPEAIEKKTVASTPSPVKKVEKKASAAANKKILRFDRLGKVSVSIQTAAKKERGCLYSLDVASYNFLAEEGMRGLKLSGVSPLVVSSKENGSALTYTTQKMSEGCSSSFSFFRDKLFFSPMEAADEPSDYVVGVSSDIQVDTSIGSMFWVYPNTRLRVQVDPAVIPDGQVTLIVRGMYIGGAMKSKSNLIQGNQKIGFMEDNGMVMVETEYQRKTKWTLIVASVRDFLLINYIAFRDADGDTVILDSSGN